MSKPNISIDLDYFLSLCRHKLNVNLDRPGSDVVNTILGIFKEILSNTQVTADTLNLEQALLPLSNIAERYARNELDDEARRFYGGGIAKVYEAQDVDRIILYQGRGGATLLTLGDCIRAYEVLGKSFADLLASENGQ